MARYKDYSYDQQKLLPVRYSEQILPGTFEYTLGYAIDHELDLSEFSMAGTATTRATHRPYDRRIRG